jgi:hypothetical protein
MTSPNKAILDERNAWHERGREGWCAFQTARLVKQEIAGAARLPETIK